ncbi:Restriction endonuclease ThaI [Candidatus Kryptobacter tengchongensis]|nr:Restriction endonuclease ThaI [Candidatus Kryptobacter tengchongensis]
MTKIYKLFEDNEIIEKIKVKLPIMFQIAEQEISRGGKVGMEVGTIREQIIIALLMYKFGEENVIPPGINSFEADVRVFDELISIKTKEGKGFSGVKIIWTVDWRKVEEFVKNYEPRTHLIFIQINWGGIGYFYFIPLEVQQEVFKKLGREAYMKIPKKGTNPRGIEFSSKALRMLVEHNGTKKIEILWLKSENIKVNPYRRWLDIWSEN